MEPTTSAEAVELIRAINECLKNTSNQALRIHLILLRAHLEDRLNTLYAQE